MLQCPRESSHSPATEDRQQPGIVRSLISSHCILFIKVVAVQNEDLNDKIPKERQTITDLLNSDLLSLGV